MMFDVFVFRHRIVKLFVRNPSFGASHKKYCFAMLMRRLLTFRSPGRQRAPLCLL